MSTYFLVRKYNQINYNIFSQRQLLLTPYKKDNKLPKVHN